MFQTLTSAAFYRAKGLKFLTSTRVSTTRAPKQTQRYAAINDLPSKAWKLGSLDRIAHRNLAGAERVLLRCSSGDGRSGSCATLE